MANKKPKTPTPPRVQAPRQRTGERGPAELEQRHRTILYALAGSGVVALVVVVAIFALGGGSSGAAAAAKAIQAQGCQYKHFPALARTPHYTSMSPSPPPKWNSVPPTSGRHYYQPLIFNQYTEPVPEIQLVHNLEHGAVILQYGSKVPSSMVDDITAWYRKDPNAVIVAPLPALGEKIALTAWTQWTECTGFDLKAANAFRKAFRYKAPEQFPPSSLNPGE